MSPASGATSQYYWYIQDMSDFMRFRGGLANSVSDLAISSYDNWSRNNKKEKKKKSLLEKNSLEGFFPIEANLFLSKVDKPGSGRSI